MESQRFKDLAAPHLLDSLLVEAKRLTRNSADANDLVQDTIERGLRHYDRFTYGSLGVWLARVMHNLFIDRCRRRRTAPVPLDPENLAAPPAVGATPRWLRVSDEMLRRAVDALDPLSRDIFIKHEVDGQAYAEIGAALGIATATVGTRLFRARLKIREHLLHSFEQDGVANE